MQRSDRSRLPAAPPRQGFRETVDQADPRFDSVLLPRPGSRAASPKAESRMASGPSRTLPSGPEPSLGYSQEKRDKADFDSTGPSWSYVLAASVANPARSCE